jgi:HK97 family phage major capsid protein
MPYPNEHACRLRNPDDFQPGSFRRMTGAQEHNGKKYDVIVGRLKGQDTLTQQAYRYPKTVWPAREAQSHCRAHDGSFEAAAKSLWLNSHEDPKMENEDVGNEIAALAESVKTTHTELKKSFEEFAKTQREAAAEFMKKGEVDPLLVQLRERIAADMLAMQEKMDAAMVALNRPRLDTDSYSEKDKEFRNAHKFFTLVAHRNRRLDAGDELPAKEVNIENYRAYKHAFMRLLRKADDRKIKVDELKALSVGSDPDGGYTVHPELSNRIIERQFESSPLRQVAMIETISSNSLELLEDPEEFSANRTSEVASGGETATPKLGKREIVAYIMEARPRASQSLLDDSSQDIEAWIARKVANKFGRIEANEFIVGNGIGKARGITTYTAGTTWGTIEQLNSGANGGATYAGLATISTSLKEMYYANAQWLLHRTLIGTILGLTASASPLWIPSIAVGQPSTLLGYPVRFAQDFTTPATNSLSGAFGDFRAGYTWVDRLGIRVQPDPYTAKPFVEFYTTKRSGGDVVDFDAIKIIKLAA